MREIRYLDAVIECFREEMKRDPNILIMGYDVGVRGSIFGLTTGLLEELGSERIRDTPISESAIIGCALGAAITGLRPIAFIHFNDFLTVCMDQIVNQTAIFRYVSGGQASVPVVIFVASGGGLSAGPQHSSSHQAWFLSTPGIKIVCPSTPADAKGLLKSSIRDNNCVIFFGHPKLYGKKGMIPEEEYTIPLGVAEVKREGKDVTLISFSNMVTKSLAAAETLEKAGVSAEVVDLRTLAPLDKQAILKSVEKTGKVVIVEEGCQTGGVGAEISAIIAQDGFSYLDAPITRVAAKDTPVPFSPPMEGYVLPSEADIVGAVKTILG